MSVDFGAEGASECANLRARLRAYPNPVANPHGGSTLPYSKGLRQPLLPRLEGTPPVIHYILTAKALGYYRVLQNLS
jgi:hypothetical protein